MRPPLKLETTALSVELRSERQLRVGQCPRSDFSQICLKLVPPHDVRSFSTSRADSCTLRTFSGSDGLVRDATPSDCRMRLLHGGKVACLQRGCCCGGGERDTSALPRKRQLATAAQHVVMGHEQTHALQQILGDSMGANLVWYDRTWAVGGDFEIGCQARSSSSSALASIRTGVSKPSVNQP